MNPAAKGSPMTRPMAYSLFKQLPRRLPKLITFTEFDSIPVSGDLISTRSTLRTPAQYDRRCRPIHGAAPLACANACFCSDDPSLFFPRLPIDEASALFPGPEDVDSVCYGLTRTGAEGHLQGFSPPKRALRGPRYDSAA